MPGAGGGIVLVGAGGRAAKETRMHRQLGLVAAVLAAGAWAGLDARKVDAGEVRYAVTDLGTVPGSTSTPASCGAMG
jgi:hypothetical protein